MVAEISAQAVTTENTDKFQKDCLNIMGNTLDVSRIYIFEHNHELDTMNNTFEWANENIQPQKDNLQGIPSSEVQWWVDTVRKNEVIRFRNIEDIPSNQVKEILREQDIKSILVVPFFVGHEYYGFIGLDECCYHRNWHDEDVDILKTITQTISGVIERKQAEDTLIQERKQLLSIFDSIDEIIYVTDPYTYEILYVNQTMKNLFQRKLVGGACYKELQDLDSPCEFCTNEIILKQKPTPYQWEFYNQNIDRNFAIVDRIIKWPDGRDVKFEIAIDITDRKRMEKQLQQVQKMQAIGTMAGGIAHDFNNILYPIIGFTEMMRDDAPEGSDLKANIDEVLTASFRARDLVQQILTFSHQDEKELKPLKIQIIIREVLKLMRSSLPSTIAIDTHIDKDCGMVLADSTHIHQIAMNLMTNAFHAMEEDGGTMGITLSEVNITVEDINSFVLSPGTFICFSVSDTGHGIEKHILDRIFEPYFTTKDQGKGTGLGLSVVHGIVKSYKGDIRVYSEPRKGTEFKVYLPTIVSKREEVRLSAGHFPVQGGDEHILLVDDEEQILKMGKQMLERLGYRVTSQTSSLEALKAFRSSSDRFDLVITDMTMPNMTGERLAFELKNIRKKIPVILCTGFSEKMSKGKADAMGIDGFLMKPIVKSELSQKIRTILDCKVEG